MTTAKELTVPFVFENDEIRTAVDENGMTYSCAIDVFAALDVKWSGRGTSLRSVPEEWLLTLNLRGRGGHKGVVFLSEPAVYRVIMRSNQPRAIKLCNWLAGEVVPQIRKQGFYGCINDAQRIQYSKALVAALKELRTADAFARQILLHEVASLCRFLGYRMPKTELIGQDPQQLNLDGV
jgi:prophage antirepressor-like protein